MVRGWIRVWKCVEKLKTHPQKTSVGQSPAVEAPSVVGEVAGAYEGGVIRMGGVSCDLLGPVAVGVVLVGVFDDGRLGERWRGWLLCGRLIGDDGSRLPRL